MDYEIAAHYNSIIRGYQTFLNGGHPPTNPTMMCLIHTLALAVVVAEETIESPRQLFELFVKYMQREGWVYGPVDSDRHYTSSLLKDWDSTSDIVRLVFHQLYHVRQKVHP